MSNETYESAGVNIAAGEQAVERITPLIEKTLRPEVLTKIGGFGGAFDITQTGRAHPVLVSSTDGVGTKAQVAMLAEQYESIGVDLVAMCVDDLVCVGAEPLFFLDYISVGTLVPDQVELLVKGISDGCEQAGCALIGGEMAEHPGLMHAGEFELVGFSVGVVDKDQMVTGESINTDDVIIGLHSPGLRSNGYSLARKVLFDTAKKSIHDPVWDGTDVTVGEELLRLFAERFFDSVDTQCSQTSFVHIIRDVAIDNETAMTVRRCSRRIVRGVPAFFVRHHASVGVGRGNLSRVLPQLAT